MLRKRPEPRWPRRIREAGWRTDEPTRVATGNPDTPRSWNPIRNALCDRIYLFLPASIEVPMSFTTRDTLVSAIWP